MNRIQFFIDGFNLYHSLIENPQYRKFLWLDLFSLAERFARKGNIELSVLYFSAYATWKPESMKRHRIFVSALEYRNVKIVMGMFKKKERYCKHCKNTFICREEKQTDVNIAISLFENAYLNLYDTAILLSNDTDLIPAILAVKRNFPRKRIGILFPIDRWSEELKNVCHFWRKIEKKDLAKCQFPEQIVLPSGIVLNRPITWR